MSSKYIKKHEIPQGFVELLSEFTKEILRNQPLDILDFGVEYFRCLQERLVLDYADKGNNLPCDFKNPFVPKMPDNLKPSSGKYEGTYIKNDADNELFKENKKEKSSQGEQKGEPAVVSEVKKEESKEEQPAAANIPKAEEEKKEEKPKVEEEKPKVEEEKPKVEEEKPKVEEEKPKVEEEKPKVEEEKPKVEEEKPKVEEEKPKVEEEKPKVEEEKPKVEEEKPKEPEKPERLVSTNYENCIDFKDKNEILESLKAGPNSDSVNGYINNVFIPNKKINDLLVTIQNLMMSYYNKKGTEQDGEYQTEYQNVMNEINNLKSQNEYPLLNIDLKSMETLEAINEFKKYDYYQKIFKSYLFKLENMEIEGNNLLDEMSYFIFYLQLKEFLDEPKPADILKNKPFITEYFNHNIQLVNPEIYLFAQGLKFYSLNELGDIFTNFEMRKRELCLSYCKLFYFGTKDREVKKKISKIHQLIFASSTQQIYDKLLTANEENKEGVFDTVTDKLMANFPHLWSFITRIVNTPIELMNSSYNCFSQFTSIERQVILKYLSLNVDYYAIYVDLSKIIIDPEESNFNHYMKKLLFDIKKIPSLNFRNKCIFRNKLFVIPETCKEFLNHFEKGNEESLKDEEKIIEEYRDKSYLAQSGIYSYLVILDIDDHKYDELLNKLKLERNKTQAQSYKMQSDALKDNFTLDSDEVVTLKKEYEEWKKDLEPEILDYFSKTDNEKEKAFKNLPNSHDQAILYYMLKTENNFTENKPYRDLLKKYKNLIPKHEKIVDTIQVDEGKEEGKKEEAVIPTDSNVNADVPDNADNANKADNADNNNAGNPPAAEDINTDKKPEQ